MYIFYVCIKYSSKMAEWHVNFSGVTVSHLHHLYDIYNIYKLMRTLSQNSTDRTETNVFVRHLLNN